MLESSSVAPCITVVVSVFETGSLPEPELLHSGRPASVRLISVPLLVLGS